jgi:glutamyl-tRNA reductase
MRHLFSVACGVDSLILGETQILGQIKSSFLEAEEVYFVDKLLGKIFYSAISFAKKIHAETKISEGKVSVGSVAIDFIKERFGSISNKNILIIGVGKVTELVLKYFRKEKPNIVFISNRTFKKAKELAIQIEAKAVRFDDLKQILKIADVIISATASPHFVIKKDDLKKYTNRKLLIIDLALPRDVEPCVEELKNVDLFCLEDLDSVIKKNIDRKTKEAEKIKAIIDIEVERLWSRMLNYEEEILRDPEALLIK